MKNIVIIVSTGGSVFSAVVSHVRDSIYCVVSDRECGAIEHAKEYGIKTIVLSSNNGKEFSLRMCDIFADIDVELFISFYTRLFEKCFIDHANGQLVNFHPSILPAFPGMNGFSDSVRFGCCMIGSTVHLIDEGVDTGKPIIQGAAPYNPNIAIAENRHKVFIQQCKELIQIIEWSNSGRIINNSIIDAKYELGEFSPNLDSSVALAFSTIND